MPVLYRGMVSHDKRLIRGISSRISAACPDVMLEFGDYGLKLIGFRCDAEGEPLIGTLRVICQPARPDNGQPEIVADVDALIKEWST